MNSTLKKLTATVAVAGALTVGAVGVAGSAFAADSTSGSTSGSSSGGAATSQTTRHPGVRAEVRKGAFKIVIDTLGVSKDDLKAALKGGQSISQYATSLGKSPQTLTDALTKAANDRIDQALANGKIDQTRADTMKSKVSARVDHFLNRTWGQKAAAASGASA